jgi:hypothetical protein
MPPNVKLPTDHKPISPLQPHLFMVLVLQVNKMAGIIEYQLPRLGLLKIEIYPYTKKAMDIMNNAGSIDVLKKNPQLGVIRNAYEGAHHTRLEYVVIQLYIISKLSESKLEGLSNSNRLIGNHNISGADILQLWSILLNIGHLYATFSNERGLLNLVKKDKKVRNCIMRGISYNMEIKQHYNNIIENDDVYRFHEILSYFFLNKLKRKYKDSINLLISVIGLYMFNNSDKIIKLKGYFKKIRQRAFLFLDTNYGPVPVTYELGQMLLDIENYKSNIFIEEDSQLQQSLNLFEDLLSESFYLNSISMHAYALQARKVFNDLRNTGDKLYSLTTLFEFLKNEDKLELIDPKSDNYEFLRLWIDDNKTNYSILRSFSAIELEEKWNRNLPLSRCFCTIEKEPKGAMLGITLSIKNGIGKTDFTKIAMKVIQLLSSFHREYLKRLPDDGYYYMVFEQSCKELLLYILNRLWKSRYIASYVYSKYSDFWALERGKINTNGMLDYILKYFVGQEMGEDRLNEIYTLREAINNMGHRGSVLFTTGRILIKQHNSNKIITDLDTVALLSDSKQLSLVLLEAKNQRNRSMTQAHNKVVSMINTLGYNSVNSLEIAGIKNRGAYSIIPLYP